MTKEQNTAFRVMQKIKLRDVRVQIRWIFERMHVGTPLDEVADEAVRRFGGKVVWEALSPSRRKALANLVGKEWARVYKEYVSVMGYSPTMSEPMVRKAMLAVRAEGKSDF